MSELSKEKLVFAPELHRARRKPRTLQLHVAVRSEVNSKFRHFGTCSQPTCFIKKLFINSCGPRSVSKMFWGYIEIRKTVFWLEGDVSVWQFQCSGSIRVFVFILYVVLKWNSSDFPWMLLRFVFTSGNSEQGRCEHFLTLLLWPRDSHKWQVISNKLCFVSL